MASIMSRIEEFVRENGMSESVKEEMIKILNESIMEISREIMSRNRVVEKKEKSVVEEKRYKSKKAEEYALEHGIRKEEFEMNEISKKDVEMKVREKTKKGVKGEEVKGEEVKREEVKREEKKREKVICSGINKKGEACKSVGTIKPEGAKKKYCFRHAEDYRSFECESDSSEDEEEKKEECKEECKECKDSDEELFEEEYN